MYALSFLPDPEEIIPYTESGPFFPSSTLNTSTTSTNLDLVPGLIPVCLEIEVGKHLILKDILRTVTLLFR